MSQNSVATECDGCYKCDMPDLNIRNVPKEMIASLKASALSNGKTLRQEVISRLFPANDRTTVTRLINPEDFVRNRSPKEVPVDVECNANLMVKPPNISKIGKMDEEPANPMNQTLRAEFFKQKGRWPEKGETL